MKLHYDHSPEARQTQADIHLTALRAAVSGGGEHLYLLIDPVSLPDDLAHPFISALVAQRPVPVILPHDKLTEESQPWLLKLDITQPEHDALLVQSIAFALEELHPERLSGGVGRAVCGWLTSPYETKVVSEQLGRTAIQRLLSGKEMLLRYYDPAVHGVLWHFFNSLQQERWLGVLSGWFYPDGDGQQVCQRHKPAAYPYQTFSLMLSPEDEVLMALTGKISRTLERYRLEMADKPRYREQVAVPQIRDALVRAEQLHGFSQEADQQALALDCLQWHPRFDTHRTVRLLLSPQERHSAADYARCVSVLTDRERQQYCDELNAIPISSTTRSLL